VFDSGTVSDAVRAKELLDGVHTALDELRRVDLDQVGDDDLGALVEDLYRLDARLTGARCTALRRFDAAKAWQPSGARTATAWVATRTHVPKAMAGSELRMARRLASHPATDAALADGDIPAEAARMLMGCAAGRTGEHFDDDAEAFLLGEAKRQRHRDLERICRYWEQVVDPDGTDDDAQARHQRRGLSLSQLPDGTWRLDSNLDVIGGTETATELRRQRPPPLPPPQPRSPRPPRRHRTGRPSRRPVSDPTSVRRTQRAVSDGRYKNSMHSVIFP
jgi:hypothetical protein